MSTVIFEIPIYAMTENKFEKKWEQKRKLQTDEWVSQGWEREKAERTVRELNGTKQLYKYNQIVGYIAVVKERNDIYFELWISENKHYRYDTSRRNNFRNSTQVGQHFRVDDKISNIDLAEEIYSWLKSEEKYQKKEGRHLELALFENTYKHIDYKAIFANIKEQYNG